jgi:putative NADPH-quinone reductase
MKKATIVLAHPNMDASLANKSIVDVVKEKAADVEIRDIYSLYPDFKIDVESEQAALEQSDVIVFQFPWFWYSAPSLLKEYIDAVFAFNWAYGPLGDKLEGKQFIISTTVGAAEDFYQPGGGNNFHMSQLLYPFEQTALKSRMRWQKPVLAYGSVYIPDIYQSKKIVKRRAQGYGEELVERIQSLTQFSEEKHIKEFFINEWLPAFDELEENGYFTAHCIADTALKINDKAYTGHEGFIEWMNSFREQYQPNLTHNVVEFNVTKADAKNEFLVSMRVDIDGQTTSGTNKAISAQANCKVAIAPNNTVLLLNADLQTQ